MARKGGGMEGGREGQTYPASFNGGSRGGGGGGGGKGDPSHQTSQSQPNLMSSSSVGGRAVRLWVGGEEGGREGGGENGLSNLSLPT